MKMRVFNLMTKKFTITILISIIAILSVFGIYIYRNARQNIYTIDGISMVSKTNNRSFLVYQKGKFNDFFLSGVNMGATIPGSFPGELAISKETYLNWFQQIHDMHSDVIRVYTTMMPHFYEALYEFNQTSKRPLYLMQGVWINEYDAKELNDAFGDHRRLLETFVKDTTDLVDIIHGNATLPHQYGFAYGIYTKDVSPYVIGWILGVEWDPQFVKSTNDNNLDITSYRGTYLSSAVNASPFEIFLTEVGDRIISYEVENYKFMRPLSFTNWLTTDPLTHPNEPDEKEDLVSVDTENIIASRFFKSGMFASYHVYPYYPEFMNYSSEYTNYIDETGNINTYKGYLADLYTKHTTPIFVAEFGVPASRGKTHDAIHSGFNQGFISEKEQGEMIVHMFKDIYDSNYAGAFVFSWQDEWFKRTWNTMDFDLPDQRPLWSNVQTNEQHFGLLALDPGENQRIRYVDGNPIDWLNDQPIYSNDQLELYTAYDERYLYIYIYAENYNFESDSLLIPISVKNNQGNSFIANSEISFSEYADFLITINGSQSSKIQVDPYYDPFYFMYHEYLRSLPINLSYRVKNTGLFIDMYQALSAEILLPESNQIIPFSKHETGRLIYGNANPNHPDYHSLSDFYFNDQNFEIKIPWQLLNVADPSTKTILSDFYINNAFEHETIENIYIGAYYTSNLNQNHFIEMISTSWDTWEMPSYHERLKQSYFIVKEAFKRYN